MCHLIEMELSTGWGRVDSQVKETVKSEGHFSPGQTAQISVTILDNMSEFTA